RVFRLMGIFAGGCDLAALQAVTSTGQQVSDPLQELTGLLDVSLITVSEGPDGEPRAGMLSTIHQYALEQLESSAEADDAHRRHGEYYATLAEETCAGLRGPGHLASLDRLDAERENLSAALRWALDAAVPRASDDEHIEVGMRLVQALAPFWYQHGHATEGRSWLTQAVRLAGRADATSARLQHWLGVLLQQQGENAEALQRFENSLAIWRELGSRDQEARELNSLGITHRHLGHSGTARSLLEESVTIARQIGDNLILAAALTNLAQVESAAGDFDRATQLLEEALEFNAARGDTLGAAISRQSLAVIRLRADRAEEARLLLLEILPDVVSSGDAEFLATTLELLAAVCASTGDQRRAGRLAGATQTIRKIAAMPIPEPDAALLETFLGPAAATIGPQAWAAELAAGQALSQDEAIELATAGG
ncbi:MAG TPA: tetratricopeptide repeat protein, partial [Streptosporangiaceae bacterium]|nr:tetratricopeptide repeat protein [Streptosporangiaceae bacterium]